MANAFDSIPYTARDHFLLLFYGAVLRLLRYVNRSNALDAGLFGDAGRRYPFLAHYHAAIVKFMPDGVGPDEQVGWWEAEVTAWQAAAHAQGLTHLPLAALQALSGVGEAGRAAFLLAGLVTEDSRFGTVLAELQEPLTSRRLTLGLTPQLLATGGPALELDAWETCRGLFQIGALEATNPAAPRSEWMLHAPTLVWDAARAALDQGEAGGYTIHPQAAFPRLDELILPDDFLARLRETPALLSGGRARALVLRGGAGSDRLSVAGAVARALGCDLIEVRPMPAAPPEGVEAAPSDDRRDRSLGILCTLVHAVPVYTFDLGPGETASLPDLPGYTGPVLVVMGSEGGLRSGATAGANRTEGALSVRTLSVRALSVSALTLNLPTPGLDLRLRHWEAAFAGTPVEGLDEIAGRFILPPGYIRQTAAMAVAQAGLEQRQTVRLEDVRRAGRALNRQLLDSLAERVEGGGEWGQLIVGAETQAKLRELEERCIHRERLLNRLGPAFGNSANRGVRALLSGSSGTGKTLATRILAGELGMDLYRVDLASVINKYIGETEKNLHRVLSRAEELDVVLLLDEGDALLGSRTDVKSSNDRYANLETNYLLQRLENYQGIVLVTTNAGQNIDSAFQRRMDVVIDFVPPGADERWGIWQLHLPVGHAVDPDFLTVVASQCNLTGGQIRNAALLATLLAINGHNGRVEDRHVQEAVGAEYRKAGAVCPLDGRGTGGPAAGRVDEFIRMVARGR